MLASLVFSLLIGKIRVFEQDNLILFNSNFQIVEPSDPSQRASTLVVMKGKS